MKTSKRSGTGRQSTRGSKPPFRTFRIPPRGFDIRCASERELLLHGIPRPPAAEIHPRLRLIWEEMADRRPRFVEPRFEPLDRFHRTGLRDHRSILDTISADSRSILTQFSDRIRDVADTALFPLILPDLSTNWCGGYLNRPLVGIAVNRPLLESFRVVSGRWTVPSVSLPAAATVNGKLVNGTYIAGVWVGIDGWKGTSDVLQAGTNSTITVAGGKVTATSYYAWTEWFGFPWTVQSLAVSPGDVISCIVCAPFSNTQGTGIINNLTTNESAIYGITAPTGTKLVGNVAEWITEDPGQTAKVLYPFANFGQVVFTHCSANTENLELDLSNARFIDLVDSAGNTRAQSFYQSRSSLRCQFVK